jgi:hypothetical protein
MTRRPAPFQELSRHQPAQSGPRRTQRPDSPHTAPERTDSSASPSHAAQIAQTQAALKRELVRVYAQACAACMRKG